MPGQDHPIFDLLKRDRRYKLEAYKFVRDALSYAHDELQMGQAVSPEGADELQTEAHLTGQQLCEAIRLYAIEQFGLMARVVLTNWGISCTSDFGEIVYNLIDIGQMKKSETDRREDFDDIYSFDEAFDRHFKITQNE